MKDPRIPEAIGRAHELSELLHKTAADIAFDAIAHRTITQQEAADAFGVHVNTIGRWIAAREVEQQ